MSDSESRIMSAINQSRTENREDFAAIHKRINDLLRDGCARAPMHRATEERVAQIEKQMWKWAGGLALLTFVISVFAPIVVRAIWR